jgi:hypothetical protein
MTWATKKSTEIAGVENEDLACWSAGAKPVLVNKLPLPPYFGGSESYCLQYVAR